MTTRDFFKTLICAIGLYLFLFKAKDLFFMIFNTLGDLYADNGRVDLNYLLYFLGLVFELVLYSLLCIFSDKVAELFIPPSKRDQIMLETKQLNMMELGLMLTASYFLLHGFSWMLKHAIMAFSEKVSNNEIAMYTTSTFTEGFIEFMLALMMFKYRNKLFSFLSKEQSRDIPPLEVKSEQDIL